ncbi:unnamed protein product, partial [Tetraodon nigroviridis]
AQVDQSVFEEMIRESLKEMEEKVKEM